MEIHCGGICTWLPFLRYAELVLKQLVPKTGGFGDQLYKTLVLWDTDRIFSCTFFTFDSKCFAALEGNNKT